MPVVDDIVASNNDVSLAHGDVLGLNSDGLGVDGATDGVAKNNEPLVFNFLILGHKDAVFVATSDSLQTFHVLNMLLIDGGVPEDDAHIVTLGLAEGEHESAREVTPHVVGLDVGKQDVRVDGKSDSETVSLPSDGVNHTSKRWDTERAQMLTEGGVELDTGFVTLNFFDTGAGDGDDIAVGVPLDVLDEHASVDENRSIVSHVSHELHATALVGDTKGWSLIVLILVGESLAI